MDDFLKTTISIANFLYSNRDIIKTWLLMLIPFFYIVACYVPKEYDKYAYSFVLLLFVSFVCFNWYIDGINKGFEKKAIVESNESMLEFYKEKVIYYKRVNSIVEPE
jgi:hypothetical protein